MDIEQLKKDQENGVMICRETYRKLVDAALLMQRALKDISYDDALDAVEAL